MNCRLCRIIYNWQTFTPQLNNIIMDILPGQWLYHIPLYWYNIIYSVTLPVINSRSCRFQFLAITNYETNVLDYKSWSQETWVWSLGREDPLKKGMDTHSNILAGIIPWTEKPGRHSPWGHKESDMTEDACT